MRWLLFCYYSIELNVRSAIVDKAVGVPLGAVVALSLGELENLPVVDHCSISFGKENNLGVIGVGVHSYACARCQATFHNLYTVVRLHLGDVFLFSALEVGQHLFLNVAEVNNHVAFVFFAEFQTAKILTYVCRTKDAGKLLRC